MKKLTDQFTSLLRKHSKNTVIIDMKYPTMQKKDLNVNTTLILDWNRISRLRLGSASLLKANRFQNESNIKNILHY